MKSDICTHWITQLNSLTADEWTGSYMVQGQSFDLEVTLQYGLLLTFLGGSQQGLRQQKPYRPLHKRDKGRTKVAGLLYTCVNSVESWKIFRKDNLKGARVLVLGRHNWAVYLLCILVLSLVKNKYEAQSGKGIIWLLKNLPNTGLSDSFFVALKISWVGLQKTFTLETAVYFLSRTNVCYFWAWSWS